MICKNTNSKQNKKYSRLTIHVSRTYIHNMNYLAHAHLSFHHPEILLGNMISDFVKGKKQFEYPDTVQKGIRLHRAIDTFTDQHPVTKQAKEFFKPAVGAYAGAYMDIVYDHFLALDNNEFSKDGLQEFSLEVYSQLAENGILFPEKFARMFPYMHSQNWLYNYRFTAGMEESFGGLVMRARYLDGYGEAFTLFTEHYNELGGYYHSFFPELKQFAFSQFEILLTQ